MEEEKKIHFTRAKEAGREITPHPQEKLKQK